MASDVLQRPFDACLMYSVVFEGFLTRGTERREKKAGVSPLCLAFSRTLGAKEPKKKVHEKKEREINYRYKTRRRSFVCASERIEERPIKNSEQTKFKCLHLEWSISES